MRPCPPWPGDPARYFPGRQPAGLQPEADWPAFKPPGGMSHISTLADAGPRAANIACIYEYLCPGRNDNTQHPRDGQALYCRRPGAPLRRSRGDPLRGRLRALQRIRSLRGLLPDHLLGPGDLGRRGALAPLAAVAVAGHRRERDHRRRVLRVPHHRPAVRPGQGPHRAVLRPGSGEHHPGGRPVLRLCGPAVAPAAGVARFRSVQAAFAAGYTYVLRTTGEEHLLYNGNNPAYAGLHPKDPSSLVYAINVPHHAPILLGAMYIENGQANGPQVGGGLTRWHSHLVVCDNNKPTIAAFAVQLRATCNPTTCRARYTEQMLHVWVVPYLGGPFSDDLSRAATNGAVHALLAHSGGSRKHHPAPPRYNIHNPPPRRAP